MTITLQNRFCCGLSRPAARAIFALLVLTATYGAAGADPAPAALTERAPHVSPMLLAQAPSPEVAFWESVRNSDDPAELEAYLKAYPDGQFAPLARIRLEKLKPDAAPEVEMPDSGRNEAQTEAGRLTLPVKVGESAGSKRGVLGVRIAPLSDVTAKGLGLSDSKGALIVEVMRNGAAQLAGIKPLDVIVDFDGRPVTDVRSLQTVVGATPPGTETRAGIIRLAPDLPKFIAELRKSAENDASAANSLGWIYAYGPASVKNEAEAARWYRTAADSGLGEAMARLGAMYANGQGVAKDDAQAVDWYRRGADKNDAEAIYNLGLMFEAGRGVTQDAAEAARLYHKAADQGQPNAMFKLGTLYINGRGVPKDDAEAVIWYRKAAEFNQPDAIANLGLMYETGRGVFSDDAQAVRFYRKAAELGQIAAMNMLANMYANGRGLPQDDAMAVSWYRRAAGLGNLHATNSLGWMYEKGRGVAKDEAEAVRWYRKAADLGHDVAMNNLGVMYENGRGVSKDQQESLRWYTKAAKIGNTDAMHNLGAAYDAGRGTQKDPRLAAQWIFKAVKAGNSFSIAQMNTNAAAYTNQFRREFQKLLRDAGVYDGAIDGEFGPSTKAAVQALSKSSGAGAAAAKTASINFEYDVDRPGSDYRSFDLEDADPALCASQCGKEAKCRAWTYVKPGVQATSARCWLKDQVPEPVTANFAVSGVREDTP